MNRLVQQIRRLVPGYDASAPDMPLNRIAQGHSHDRALAAFKADQIRVAAPGPADGVARKQGRARLRGAREKTSKKRGA